MRNDKTVLLLSIFIIFSFPAVSGQTITERIIIDGVIIDGMSHGAEIIKGSGIPGREHRETSEFHSVKISGNVGVNYQRGNNRAIEITGDINILPLIKTEISQGVLIISPIQNHQTRLPIIIELSAPSLNALEMNGGGNVRLKDLDQKSLKLELNGNGDIFAEGNVQQILIHLNGSSDIDAKGLVCDKAEIKILGSGNVDIHVHQLLKADIIGSGNIKYYGNPSKIERVILGSGNIESGD